MITEHRNLIDTSGRVYCYHQDKIVTLDDEFIQNHCLSCPYYVSDRMQGTGIVCAFDDKSEKHWALFFDSGDSEKWSKWLFVRMKLKTTAEVEDRLEGYPTYEKESQIASE